ncbi:MAG TPA: hypothetical protein VJR06_04485 [Nitrososphaerales archaeon]|nr:hypothetical protein [Nitrososphaerales archaeon]
MNMEGRQFGVGLAAGILLALTIVAASGGLGLAQTVFAPSSAQETAATTTTWVTTVYSATTSAPTGSVTYGGNGTAVTPATTTTASATGTSAGSSNLLLGSIQAALPSTRYAAVASQSPASNAFLIVPVLLALILGAVLYRAYAKRMPTGDEQ